MTGPWKKLPNGGRFRVVRPASTAERLDEWSAKLRHPVQVGGIDPTIPLTMHRSRAPARKGAA